MTLQQKQVRLSAVNHVVYVVKDMRRALEFYTGVLGLRHIQKMVDSDAIEWLQLPSKSMVHLVERREEGPPSPVLHSAFEVEEFDATVEALKARGIPIGTSGVRKDGQRFLFITDPDGNRIELCTPSGF